LPNIRSEYLPNRGDEAVPSRDESYTQALAEIALQQIKALNLPADPVSYEVWYAYTAAQNPHLSQKMNDLLSGGNKPSVDDVDSVYNEFLSPAHLASGVEEAGSQMADEVEHIVDLIEAATSSFTAYRGALANADGQFGRTTDRQTLRAIVQSLIRSTKEIEQRNADLEVALKSSRQAIEALRDSLIAIRAQSLTDSLTSTSNRRHFDQVIYHAVSHARRSKKPLSLLMLDIDGFKIFNDANGHQVGDDVLRLIASTLKQSLKGQPFVARYGGEEFAVLLPNTQLSQAVAAAEDVRRDVAAREIMRRSTGESLGRVTVSLGAAEYCEGESVQIFVKRADRCLYVAKQQGRNRVAC